MGSRRGRFPDHSERHQPVFDALGFLLQELQREFALTYVFISHSLPVVAQVATHIAVMRAGQFLEVGRAEQVLHQPKNNYTRELLAAVPELPHA